MPSDTSRRGRETVTAFFETRSDAQAALDRLRHEGIAVEHAQIYDGAPDEALAAATDRETRHKGFFEKLGDLFLPSEDRGTYAEGLSRGGTLLSLPVLPGDRSRVLDLLDDAGTVDLDEREDSWRAEGWGGPATSPVFGDASLAATGGDADRTVATSDAGLRSGISGIGGHAAGAPPASFARRDDSLGRRRARSYRWDEEPLDRTDVEIEDGRREDDADLRGTGTRGRSPLDL
ncbi:hypothetical protein ASG54_17050 [Aureimonas sp. Leaf460]|uniref:hypothetical protein n=1 Tax=Aureimonas sp. Leaf460 TaxID=1736384 RepID=UPI0006F66EA8|nr:hypothetical protein [Aureimonas sp. Leaf460]KQT73284.1 hypothetical protein ASG54_17050 [Aureimonas sp. Leaf460]